MEETISAKALSLPACLGSGQEAMVAGAEGVEGQVEAGGRGWRKGFVVLRVRWEPVGLLTTFTQSPRHSDTDTHIHTHARPQLYRCTIISHHPARQQVTPTLSPTFTHSRT